MPHSSSSLHHLESAHLPLTDSVPLAKLSPGSQTPSSPGDWESAFSAGGWEAGGEGMGIPIPPAPQTHTPARDTCSGSPPCSLLSGRISTLKDETGAVSRARAEMGQRVTRRDRIPTQPRYLSRSSFAPLPRRSSSTGTPPSSPLSSTSCVPKSWTPGWHGE